LLAAGCTDSTDSTDSSGESTPLDSSGIAASVTQAAVPFVVPQSVNSVAAQNFIDAWETSRTSAWYVRTEFTRTQDGAVTFSSSSTRAQQPPNQVYRNDSELDRVVAGMRTQCGFNGAEWQCSDTVAFDVAQQVAAEVAAIAELAQGPDRVYEVDEDPSSDGRTCYRLGLSDSNALGPPYGVASRLCFDDATGAPTSVEIVRQLGSIDRTEAVEMRADAPADVFDLPV